MFNDSPAVVEHTGIGGLWHSISRKASALVADEAPQVVASHVLEAGARGCGAKDSGGR